MPVKQWLLRRAPVMDVRYWNACRFQSVAVRFLYMLSFAVLTHSSVPRAVRKIGKPT